MDALPTDVLRRILALASRETVLDIMPRTPQLPQALLATLARVSPAWHRAVQALRRSFAQTTVVFTFQPPLQRCEDIEAQRLLLQCHAQVSTLQLRLSLAKYQALKDAQGARARVAAFDSCDVDWHAVFAKCPRLERLDLSCMPLHSQHLPQILHAASMQCPEMKALVLPSPEWFCPAAWMDWRPVMDALYASLERWHHDGRYGGLRQLTVPRRAGSRDHFMVLRRLTEQYLHAVAMYCPEIEYLDGWMTTYVEREHDGIFCQELLLCSLPTWQIFCSACTKLREANWFILPFVDGFFDAVQATTQQNMRRLTFAGGERTCFDGDTIFNNYCEDGSHWHYSKANLARVVGACPALEELRMVFENDRIADNFRLQDVDDEFICAAAQTCPKLRRFEMVELNAQDKLTAVSRVSSTGVTALARLPELHEIRVKATQCSGASICELIRHAPTVGMPRVVDLTMSPSATGETPDISSVMEDALTQMLLLPHIVDLRKFHIRITGAAGLPSLCSWKVAVDEVLRIYPDLFISVVERNNQVEAILSTTKALQPQPPQWFEVEWLDEIMTPVLDLAANSLRLFDEMWRGLTSESMAFSWWRARADRSAHAIVNAV